MADAAELSVVVQGRDAGLSALLQRVEASLRSTDAAAQRSNAETLQLASGYSRLASALGQPAAGAQALRSVLSGLTDVEDRVGVAIQSQIARLDQQAAKMKEGGGIAQKFAGELASMGTSLVGVGAAIGGAVAIFDSFKKAFDFKASLDATTSAVNIQLRGVRDSGQVWQEASAYAQRYKLTQEETANAVRASVAIFRNSTASVSDTLSVLQRLTVLAPGKSIEDAAFSVKELASGDITSLAEQFDVSRKKAYEMRDAINNGADVVSVLSKYLDSAGVSMDTLKVKTEGVLGAQKDVKIATEELTKAQAEWAAGPGLTLLYAQIGLTRGATRALKGDFVDLAASQKQAMQDNPALKLDPLYLAQAKAIELIAQKQKEFNAAQAESRQERIDTSYQAGLESLAVAFAAGKLSADQYSAAIAALTAQHDALVSGVTAAAGSEEQASDVTDRHTEASTRAAQAASQRQAAIKSVATSLVDEAAKQVTSEEKANALYAIQSDLAQLGGAVAAGHITAGEGAIQLAQKYGIAIDQARLLLDLEARIAGGKGRLADQASKTTELVPGGVGFDAPGRSGTGDVNAAITGYQQAKKDAEAAARAEKDYQLAIADRSDKLRILRSDLAKTTVGSAEYYAIQTKIAQEEKSGAKKGGGTADKLANAQQDFYNKQEDAERAHQQKLVDIAADYAEKRAAAERQFNQTQLDDRASFYERLANVKDPKQQQALSAEYEEAVKKAQEIGRTVGADAGEAYLKAREEAIQKESATKQKIAELESDETADGKKKSKAQQEQDRNAAEYYKGVLKLQQDADNARLKAIEEGGSAIAKEYEKQYRAEEKAYEEHLDRQLEIYDRKVNKITKGKGGQTGLLPPPPGQATDTAGGATPADKAAAAPPPAPSGQAQPVEDVATPPAIDAQTTTLAGLLRDVVAAIKDLRAGIDAVRSEVSGLKSSKAFQGG